MEIKEEVGLSSIRKNGCQEPQVVNPKPEVLGEPQIDPSMEPTTPPGGKNLGGEPPKSPSFRRTGSLGKGARKVTTPQRPFLATEARSLIRPCGCGKDGVFHKGHGHGLDHHHHHKASPSPERTRREAKSPIKSPLVSRKSKTTPRPQANCPQVLDVPKECPPKNLEGLNRFVSTVVWYPELKPEFNSTILTLSPGEDSTKYIDEILVKEYDNYIKKMFFASSNDQKKCLENLMPSKSQSFQATFTSSIQANEKNSPRIKPVTVA